MRVEYPLCRKYKLLRTPNRGGKPVVSTAALHALLGEKIYQEATHVFQYERTSGPLPDAIEEFLKQLPKKDLKCAIQR